MSETWFENLPSPDLDLTDPQVREMAERNHRPEERWTVGSRLINVACSTCYQPWPCETRQALRRMETHR